MYKLRNWSSKSDQWHNNMCKGYPLWQRAQHMIYLINFIQISEWITQRWDSCLCSYFRISGSYLEVPLLSHPTLFDKPLIISLRFVNMVVFTKCSFCFVLTPRGWSSYGVISLLGGCSCRCLFRCHETVPLRSARSTYTILREEVMFREADLYPLCFARRTVSLLYFAKWISMGRHCFYVFRLFPQGHVPSLR